VQARDEVLQVMYWMLGEGIAHEVDPAYVARFLVMPHDTVAAALAGLRDAGLVLRGGAAESYRLTKDGIEEGGRRFHEEFRDLTKQPHGECAPGCWCHSPEGEGKPCPSVTRAASAASVSSV
jgi:hypothetical protein